MSVYERKYLKYKKKYENLKQKGGEYEGDIPCIKDNVMSKNAKGYHILLDYSNMPHGDLENNVNTLIQLVENTVTVAKLNVLDRSINILGKSTGTPPGMALTYTLDQSHMTCHYYNDLGILAADIFTCGDLSKGKLAGCYFMHEIKRLYPMIKLRSKHVIRRFYYNPNE